MVKLWNWRRPKHEPLDLTRHEPAQFAGKTLTIHGCEYRIGALFRNTAQGYAHALLNRQSCMCLHVVQVRPEYRSQPSAALAASQIKQTATARIRDRLLVGSNGVVVSPVTAIESHGGSFELHEVHWGMLADDAAPEAAADIARAGLAHKEGAVDMALEIMAQVSRKYPTHTAVLYSLGAMLAEGGRPGEALACLEKAVEVEPNYSLYHGKLIEITAQLAKRHALQRFDDYKSRYAHVPDFDAMGAQLYMFAGDPARAETLVRSAPLSAMARDALMAEVTSARIARQRFDGLRRDLAANHHADLASPTVLQALTALHEASPRDADIQACLGLRLRAAGEWAKAGPLLIGAADGIEPQLAPYCYANAGYCCLESGDWDRGMALLDFSMKLVCQVDPDPKPADIPGLVTWISEQSMVLESIKPSAADLLARALQQAPDPTRVPASVVRMAALQRQFAARLDSPVRSAG